MSKIKVSTLTGELLDYWVGVADEVIDLTQDQSRCYYRPDKISRISIYSPSTEWSQGGKIIEREKISVSHYEFYGDGCNKPPTLAR